MIYAVNGKNATWHPQITAVAFISAIISQLYVIVKFFFKKIQKIS